MKIKHQEIAIDPEHPFANCRLDREKYAAILTSLVGNYADGFVLAINNEWGTGKTTFVKMWKQMLKNSGFKTLYFNAWENDFENGALAALMSELSSLKDGNTEALFKSVLAKGAVLTKSAIPILLKSIASKYIGENAVKELIDGIAEGANELLQTQIQEYTTKKEGLKEFKESLADFVQKLSGGKPIVFIIDELDRCRPDYAVDVLEKVKHFFGVPGIVFVLSIDKIQLGHAVRGVYGSENLDADEYLRRFIDIEYSIPEPNAELFCKYLFEYYGFDEFFNNIARNRLQDFQDERKEFLKCVVVLSNQKKLTLRQLEKILGHSRIVLTLIKSNNYLFPNLLLLLIYIKFFHRRLYDNISARRLLNQELIDEVENLFPPALDKDHNRPIAYALAQMVFFYNNYYGYGKPSLIVNYDNGDKGVAVKSKLNSNSDDIFERIIIHYHETFKYEDLQLSYLLGLIDFLTKLN